MDNAIKQIIESKVRRRQRQAPVTDLPPAVLDSFSEESLDVLRTFGIEDPNILNNYACHVEDALIEQVKKVQELKVLCVQMWDELKELREQNAVTVDDAEDLQVKADRLY